MSYIDKKKVEAVAKDMKRESIKLTTETSTIATLQSEKAELVEFIQWAIDNNVMSVVGDDKAKQLLTKIK